ncbi:transcription termination/antitermination NusG family protein [Candidatus Stoquefichus sp. SB1]|uniref:transcription termination/antitermination NusG family protein n=1 Tax=Candidatus Stoquefichus sp. SB1 TaxID=1658109 RepID=UPI00067E7837|nr:transcription termination/antitermination NusG family protein [Candidatus Stoquefichus sp. SB1]
MNWYVLYVLSNKTNKILSNLNQREELTAFIPKSEVFHREAKTKTVRDMFNNYIFVKSDMNQSDFNNLLLSMKEENDGLIKQLENAEVSALREKEIEFFNTVLDDEYVARVSVGYQENGKTVITSGPLLHYQDHIIRVIKHHCIAQLDLPFFDRKIVLGVEIKSKN